MLATTGKGNVEYYRDKIRMANEMITPNGEVNDGTNEIPAKFEQAQKVYVKDNGGIYEATILHIYERSRLEHMCHVNRGASLKSKRQYLESACNFLEESSDSFGCWAYFIHFNGWKTRWDKWVWECVLLRDEAETREAVQRYQENARSEKIRQRELKKNKTNGRSNDESRRKRGRPKKEVVVHKSGANEDYNEQNETQTNTAQENHGDLNRKYAKDEFFEWPNILREILVYDRGQINGIAGVARRVLDVPSACPISNMLIAFRKEVDKRIEKRFKDVTDTDTLARMEELKINWVKFIQGLVSLFEKVCGKYLLYRHETQQYAAMLKDESLQQDRKCHIYGCIYLLRLFIILPQLIDEGCISEDQTAEIKMKSQDLLKFLAKKHVKYFQSIYRIPTYNELLNEENSGVLTHETGAADPPASADGNNRFIKTQLKK